MSGRHQHASRADHVIPELGGHDVSYHMAGLLFAMRYYYVAPDPIRALLAGMIRKSCDWELLYVKDTGTIDSSTSTRAEHEIASGILKHPNLREIFQIFPMPT